MPDLPDETVELAAMARGLDEITSAFGDRNGWALQPASPGSTLLDEHRADERLYPLLWGAIDLGTMYNAMMGDQLPVLAASLSQQNLTGCLPSVRAILELSARAFYMLDMRQSPLERARRFINENLDSVWEKARHHVAAGKPTEQFADSVAQWLTLGSNLGFETTSAPIPDSVGRFRAAPKVGDKRPSMQKLLSSDYLPIPEGNSTFQNAYRQASSIHGSVHLMHLMQKADLHWKTALHARHLYAVHLAVFQAMGVAAEVCGWNMEIYQTQFRMRMARLREIMLERTEGYEA